ncbi:hypothetical protein [Sphaerisporangium sp. NPDC051011]|uniref:hypothetical protein n=1 Tax=Sphaerisporangium sp. NPDC051011 TaxID=3155792 RepID=UPI0033FC1B44
MSAPSLDQLQQRHGRTWQIMDFFGGWIAIRRHSWSARAERFGIRNVLGADTLAELAVRLDEQSQGEARRNGLFLHGSARDAG